MQTSNQKFLPEILARIQSFQDLLSRIYNISISICNDCGGDFTVPSGQTDYCNKNASLSGKVCINYFKRMCQEADERKSLIISRCPFSSRVAVAPMECMLGSEAMGKTRYFLVLIQPGNGLWDQAESNDDSLVQFREFAELATDCMDIIFTLMEQAKLLPEPQSGIKQENYEHLTAREKEIVRLVSNGMSNQEIAEHLIISEHTVKTHISNIMKKLELNNRTKIALYEMQSL